MIKNVFFRIIRRSKNIEFWNQRFELVQECLQYAEHSGYNQGIIIGDWY